MLPHTTRVENPYEIVPQPSVAMSNKVRPALPSEEWRATLERRFKNFRKVRGHIYFASENQSCFQNSTQPTIHVFKPIDEKVIPEKKDRDAWYAFLAGLPESEWNPPKKPKVSKARDRYGRVMRGFSEDQVSTQSDETWRVNEEGEVEMAVTADPSESLPTPSGSPAPQQSTSPREPTPHLLKYIDDVRFRFDNRACANQLAENLTSFANVFHVLDQHSVGKISDYRYSRHVLAMDLCAPCTGG